MNADSRVLFRVLLCVAFIASLYGGMALLTAVMFVKGHTILAVLSGLILAAMTAMALALAVLAWLMPTDAAEDDGAELVVKPG